MNKWFKRNKLLKVIIIVVLLLLLKENGYLGREAPPIIKGGGMGQGGAPGREGIAITDMGRHGGSYQMGKYHSASWTGDSPASVSGQTTFDLKEYPLGDRNNADDYATNINEPKSQSRSEIPIVIFNTGKIYTGGDVNFKWKRHSDGVIVYEFNYDIPSPSSQGYEWWNWYSAWSWIGYFPHEINAPGGYSVEITTSWGSKMIGFTVIDTISCSDGTPKESCSSDIPKYCNSDGILIDNCQQCGCPELYTCDEDGSCTPMICWTITNNQCEEISCIATIFPSYNTLDECKENLEPTILTCWKIENNECISYTKEFRGELPISYCLGDYYTRSACEENLRYQCWQIEDNQCVEYNNYSHCVVMKNYLNLGDCQQDLEYSCWYIENNKCVEYNDFAYCMAEVVGNYPTLEECEVNLDRECIIDGDCPQDICFGSTCIDNICHYLEGMPGPPSECVETALWKDYPECRWKCPSRIAECQVDNDCTMEIDASNDCSLFWRPHKETIMGKCENNICVSTARTAACTRFQLFLQDYKWAILGLFIIIIYLLWERGPKRGFFKK